MLMRTALDELQRLEGAGCVVLGDPGYYGRFGFMLSLASSCPVPLEFFQAVSFGAELPVGRVHYHEAFDATS